MGEILGSKVPSRYIQHRVNSRRGIAGTEKSYEATSYFFLLVQKVNYDQLKFMIKLINQCLTVALRVSAFQNA